MVLEAVIERAISLPEIKPSHLEQVFERLIFASSSYSLSAIEKILKLRKDIPIALLEWGKEYTLHMDSLVGADYYGYHDHTEELNYLTEIFECFRKSTEAKSRP